MSTKGTRSKVSPQPPPPSLNANILRAQVILGCPSSGCEGVGICRVIGTLQPIDLKCPRVIAFINHTEDGKVRFSFLKSSMEPRYLRKHFRWLLFQVGETYRLPNSMIRRLKIPAKDSIIYAGIYPVWETDTFLIVDF